MSGIELEKMKKDELVAYAKDLISKYTELANMYNTLIAKVPETPETIESPEQKLEIENLNKRISELKEILDQKDIVINNLMIENKNPKINDINALKKASDANVSVQFYKVLGYENRVNNSKEYGGREFEIASFTVKYDNGRLTWDVDFKGSELYEPYKESFSNQLSENKIESLLTNVCLHGWYKFLKSAIRIPSEFDSETFFELFGKIQK